MMYLVTDHGPTFIMASATFIVARWMWMYICSPSARKPLPDVDPAQLTPILEADSLEFRRQLKKVLSTDKTFVVTPEEFELSVLEQRKLAINRVRRMLSSGLVSVRHILSDPLRFIAAHEVFAMTDPSAIYLFSVHFNLFGGSVLKLGTQRHHDAYLESIDNLTLPGCFALTEFAHGVNSGMFMDTTAVYNADKEEFVIHTPNTGAQKNWISFAATHARAAVVFAQLSVNGKEEGVHAFMMPVRTESGKLLPGVRIEDVGHKPTLNGNDNGRLFFNNVRVPRENLLDRFSQVSADGVFTCEFPKLRDRFLKVSDQLMSGRMCIAAASITLMKMSVLAATRYSLARRQAVRGGGHTTLYSLLSQRRVLLPAIATTFALGLAVNDCKEMYARDAQPGGTPRARELALRRVCTLKAHCTLTAVAMTGACRDKCGGQGLISTNRMSDLNAVAVSLVVVEGDSMLLAQKVAGELLKEATSVGNIAGLLLGAARGVTRVLRVRGAELNVMTQRCQLELLRVREELLTHQLLWAVVKEKQRDPKGVVAAWGQRLLPVVLALHTAHSERVAAEAMWTAVERCDGERATKMTLEALAQLYALHVIEKDLGWFLTHTSLSSSASQAITQGVNELCHQITPSVAASLVTSFGIPEVLITMPIAQGDLWESSMA